MTSNWSVSHLSSSYGSNSRWRRCVWSSAAHYRSTGPFCFRWHTSTGRKLHVTDDAPTPVSPDFNDRSHLEYLEALLKLHLSSRIILTPVALPRVALRAEREAAFRLGWRPLNRTKPGRVVDKRTHLSSSSPFAQAEAAEDHYLPLHIHHAMTWPNGKHHIMTSIDPFTDSCLPPPPLDTSTHTHTPLHFALRCLHPSLWRRSRQSGWSAASRAGRHVTALI